MQCLLVSKCMQMHTTYTIHSFSELYSTVVSMIGFCAAVVSHDN